MNQRDTDYEALAAQLEGLLSGETDPLANSANFVALLWQSLPDLNWLGIYVARDRELVLGPFQGKPACVRIPVGKGVCGTSAAAKRALRVDDVDSFAGHIACDADSRSELVVPLLVEDRLVGVLDIDSPYPARFTETDERGVTQLCRVFTDSLMANGGAFI